jgi:hypothetical protein
MTMGGRMALPSITTGRHSTRGMTGTSPPSLPHPIPPPGPPGGGMFVYRLSDNR